jgi:hypothetical protein
MFRSPIWFHVTTLFAAVKFVVHSSRWSLLVVIAGVEVHHVGVYVVCNSLCAVKLRYMRRRAPVHVRSKQASSGETANGFSWSLTVAVLVAWLSKQLT